MRFLIKLFFNFLKNAWGCFHTPYATYRKLATADPYELLPLFALIGVYFFFISPIKLHTLHPLILTLNTSRLYTITIALFMGTCLLLYVFGKRVGGAPTLRSVLLTWGYSLIPTLLWFFATSIFYVLLPPPRQQTVQGWIFSVLFISFSVSLFFWKGLLYYLTLRFGLRLNLQRGIIVSLIFLPLLFVVSFLLYTAGVFKVPFV